MSTHQKYDLLTSPEAICLQQDQPESCPTQDSGVGSMRLVQARHRRLLRDSRMYLISKASVDTIRFRQLATRLSRLDHPLIPHLIDVAENDDSFQLIFEYVSDDPIELSDLSSVQASGPLAELQFWQQVASALSHAAVQGVAHGALGLHSFRKDWSTDARNESPSNCSSNLKLDGLGLQQLSEESQLKTLLARDLASLKQFVDTALLRVLDAEINHDESRSSEAKSIEQFRARLAEQAENNIERFSADFGKWLRRELSIREARKLAVSDRSVTNAEAKQSVVWQIALAAMASVLVLSAGLAWWFWGRPSDSTVAQNSASPTASHEQVSSGDDGVPSSVTSSLRDVGKLNNPDFVDETKGDEVEPAVGKPLGSPDKLDNELISKSDVEPPPEGTPSSGTTADEDLEDPPGGEGVQEESDARTSTPFAEAPNAVDLPDHNSQKAVKLLTTALQSNETIQLSLVSASAVLYPRFSLQAGDRANRWRVTAHYRDKLSTIAEFARSDGGLYFRWLPVAASYPNARQLRNSFLSLSSGTWNTDVALRTPVKKRGIVFDLEPNRGFDFGIESPPGDMFLEFLSSEKSLVVASPLRVAWKDGVMSLGLDAGKKSKFVLQLRPQSKSRVKTQTLARPKVGSSFAIKKGFGRSLRSNVQAMAVRLFQMKQSVNQIRGENADENKKRMRSMIARLEDEKAEGEKFLESYLAARMTRVELRVGCEIDGRTLVLAEFVEPQPSD